MVPEGGREEPVARGEEGKPPRGQSIPVSGKWRAGGGDAGDRGGETEGKKEGRDRGVQEINRGCGASGETRNTQRGRDGEELTARESQRQALGD